MSPTTIPYSTTTLHERWKDLRAKLHTGKTSIDRASFYMLNLYRTNLDVRFRNIDESTLQTPHQRQIYATVSQMFIAQDQERPGSPDFDWDEIYKMERLIALLLTGAQLQQEIDARLKELASEHADCADLLRKDYDALLKPAEGAAAPDDGLLRGFLLRVLEGLHWHAKKKYLARPIRKEATKIILFCVMAAFLMLIAPYVLVNFNSTPPSETSKWWSLFALYTALTSGLLGAFFSRLIWVQRHWADMTLDEVFLHRELSYTLLRAGVGMCGALIVYFFLRSGILEGSLFPEFEKVAMEFVNVSSDHTVTMSFVMPSEALALLTFWCFLAGFSEALVPSILASTESKLSDASTARAKVG
ncbi:MAG: hypothetical protein V7604_421 [Hyphomicrobiales bacterium]|jgi:hypothetical protein